MATMDMLMQSLSSGDFSSVNPSQFYSLLDTLQGMDGLNQDDLQQLEHSYSQYVKLSASLGSSNFGSYNSSSNAIFVPNNRQQMNPRMSPHISPKISPINSPLSRSPVAYSPGSVSGAYATNIPYDRNVPSPNHSPAGSPVMRNALLSSGSLTSSNNTTLLSPNQLHIASSPQRYTVQNNYSAGSPTNNYSAGSPLTTEQEFLSSAARSDLLLEDDDEFDWSSIM